jgi:hypothetical protein
VDDPELVVAADGVSEVPADESDSFAADMPGVAARGPTPTAAVAAGAIPVEAGAVPVGAG